MSDGKITEIQNTFNEVDALLRERLKVLGGLPKLPLNSAALGGDRCDGHTAS